MPRKVGDYFGEDRFARSLVVLVRVSAVHEQPMLIAHLATREATRVARTDSVSAVARLDFIPVR
jgi:hypothetical protein